MDLCSLLYTAAGYFSMTEKLVEKKIFQSKTNDIPNSRGGVSTYINCNIASNSIHTYIDTYLNIGNCTKFFPLHYI